MNKVILGVVLGGVLGIFDGFTAWFTPAARPDIVQIVIGSTFKGLIAGVLIGWFSRKVNSLLWGIVFGTAVGMFLAFLVAHLGGRYYFEIMLPGSIVGLIVGYATQRYGSEPNATPARS
jgi:dipeptide/tripeptide permease